MFNIEKVPGWAYNGCYYFAGVAIATLIFGLIVLANVKKPSLLFVVLHVSSVLISSGIAFLLFWMCRSSLKPETK
jgi:hypothetical protein